MRAPVRFAAGVTALHHLGLNFLMPLAVFPDGANFGRGTMSFGGLSFVFYIVDGGRFKLMESDGQFFIFGDALQQSATVATQNSGFTGDFTFLIGGSAVLGTAGPVARAAAFTADGGGNLGAIALYERDGFRIAGLRRRYYQDNGEDALIMWRTPATLEGRLDDVPAADPVAHHRP